jgi:gliding motility-associated lipoprotein GldD
MWIESRFKHIVTVASLALISVSSCRDAPVPKPRGYHRIAIPEPAYQPYSHPCGPAFDVPHYAKIELVVQGQSKEDCWFNVSIPNLRAKVHCSYIPLQSESHLQGMMEDGHKMVFAHEAKATGIAAQRFDFPENNVSGLFYELSGPVATPLQFVATDSTNHFLRGSLYFLHVPNPDSIAPALEHVTKDVVHLIETLKWEAS